jgi:hypothetical protein
MKKIIVIMMILVLNQVQAFELKAGSDIDEVYKSMKNYKTTALQMAGVNGNILSFWEIGEGILIVSSSPKERIVVSISFRLIGNGTRSTRKNYSFKVKKFDTKSKELILDMKKK